MSYKVHEQNGNWMLSKDGEGVSIAGGIPIGYETYHQLKAAPHTVGEHFHRDAKGKLVAKVNKQAS